MSFKPQTIIIIIIIIIINIIVVIYNSKNPYHIVYEYLYNYEAYIVPGVSVPHSHGLSSNICIEPIQPNSPNW